MATTPPASIEITPDLVDEALMVLRDDPLVARGIGDRWEVVGPPEPMATGNATVGLVFLVRTPEPIALPVGMPTWKGTGEGGPFEPTLSDEVAPPSSYFNVFVGGDMAVQYVVAYPDEFGNRRRAELEASG